ncbi:MAG: response regulator [Magnetococcales bacterium]|nr:response regulator [Magnetococcales bacterium]
MVNEDKRRHVALVVEDDQEIADELQELLHSLGHDMVNVPSQEEAMELVKSRPFCFVFLDLQIKTGPESIRPRVEAGKTLLRMMRERFPLRNQEDQHHQQILVMSGHAKESKDIVECLQNGADDFILKPLSNNTPPLTTKIEDCLRKSSRLDHAKCMLVTEMARQKTLPPGASSDATVSGVLLSITGEIQGKRSGIMIGDRSCFIPDIQLQLLLRLAHARVRNGNGWTHKIDLGAKDEEGFRLMSDLNASIQPFLPEGFTFYDNDKKGSYRINPGIKIGRIDHGRLGQHALKAIREISSLIQNAR